MAISRDGKSLYAVAWTNGTTFDSYFVDVIDTQTNVLSTSIALGTTNGDSKMAVSPDGSHAYVISDSGLVWVIDTMKNAVLTSVTISEGNPLLGVAVTPDGMRVYVTGGNDTIYVLDAATNRVVDTIRKSDYAGGLAIARAR